MIALYGMSYQKNMKQELVKEMVIALNGTFDFAPFDLEEAAEEFPVGFAEVFLSSESRLQQVHCLVTFPLCDSVL